MSGWFSSARAGAGAAPEGAGQPAGAAASAPQYLPKPPTRPADWIVEHDPVNPNASPEARALLKYLYSISGKHTIIGQHNFAGVHELSTAVAARGLGKTPALYGTDWGFSKAGDIDSIYARDNTVNTKDERRRESPAPPYGLPVDEQPGNIQLRPPLRNGNNVNVDIRDGWLVAFLRAPSFPLFLLPRRQQ